METVKTATNRTFAQIICVAFISRKQIAKVLQTDCATLCRPQTLRLDFGQLPCCPVLPCCPALRCSPLLPLLSLQNETEPNGTQCFWPDPLLLASTTGMTCCSSLAPGTPGGLWGRAGLGKGYLKVLPLCRHKSLAVKSQLTARASCSNLRPAPREKQRDRERETQFNFKWSRSRSWQVEEKGMRHYFVVLVLVVVRLFRLVFILR